MEWSEKKHVTSWLVDSVNACEKCGNFSGSFWSFPRSLFHSVRVFGPRSVTVCVCLCGEVATASSSSNITSDSGTATFYGILLIKIFNMICTTWVSVGLTLVWLCAKTHFFWATPLSCSLFLLLVLPCSMLIVAAVPAMATTTVAQLLMYPLASIKLHNEKCD